MSRRATDRVSVGVEALRRLTADDGPLAIVTRTRLLERAQARGRRRLWPGLAGGVSLLVVVTGAVAATMIARRDREPPGTPPAAAALRGPKIGAHAPLPPQPGEVPPLPGAAAPVAAPATIGPAPGLRAGDAELASYGAAHAAHFARKEPAAALRLWTAYLRRYPQGRFVPEATYNRALVLIRLGRAAQASAALRPIAAGRFGDYRRQEAEALLAALGAD